MNETSTYIDRINAKFDWVGGTTSNIGFLGVYEGSEAWKRCGITFNPSSDERVDYLKAAAAVFMQAINCASQTLDPETSSFGYHAMEQAKDRLEEAQMLAVKGLFVD